MYKVELRNVILMEINVIGFIQPLAVIATTQKQD